MVCLILRLLKVFTGSHPFSELTPAAAVFKMIIQRELPDRPQEKDLTDLVWEMTVRCWEHEPDRRPRMTEVVTTLREWQVLFLRHEHRDQHVSTSCSHRSFISAAQLSTDLKPRARSRRYRLSDYFAHPPTDLEPPAPSGSGGLLISDDQRLTNPEVPAPPWLRSTHPPGFEDACRRIDKVAEVIQPSMSSPRSDDSIQGALSRKTRIEI